MPRRLVYLLDHNPENEVTCTTFITDVMKREAFGSVPLDDVNHALRPSERLELSALDRKVIMGLAMRSRRGDEKPALSIGKAIPGELIWLDQPEGMIQPGVKIVDSAAHPLATTPPAYFDADNNQIGSLALTAPETAVADWIRACSMNLKAAHKWFSKLKQRHSDASLPLPPELHIEGFTGQPQTTLTLKERVLASEDSADPAKLLPLPQTVCLELTFTYGKKTFDWDAE